MSQLFGRISKLSSSPLKRRLCFSRSDFSTTPTPYLFLGRDVVGKSSCGGSVVNYNLYDPRKEEQMQFENQVLSKDLRKSSAIGSSRGWLAMLNKHDSTVRLTNIFNNNPSKTITLPPLIKDEAESLFNVSVSSSSHDDFVVAARFDGSRLSLCRLGDSEWTRIDVPCPAFRLSPVMYSDRHRKFFVNSVSSDYTGPTDFTSKSGLVSPVSGYVRFPLSNSPISENALDIQRLNVHQLLVQSPSSESFIVLWGLDRFTGKGEAVEWKDEIYNQNQDDLVVMTRKIRVYRQDAEKGIGPYTEDIGDLCIFVGENEPFCLSASDYPGLKPNSVYFAGRRSGFGVCDLASRTIRYLSDSPLRHRLLWLPPTTPHY
ncbi:hypothetical protein CARUB_v10015367mg [Capsella rubella]|uniref:KIB1-4 beta-propeller domain-containing protein n=1 Tax=Capsella rubella TaxID=81985 RepID=R0G8Z5_9BRAS|nr:uncharacterized protein LOC17890681 [Capsella rubella]EOA32117.1 hypothetical protein CARUB_v10015367mg [Capsella rubella]